MKNIKFIIPVIVVALLLFVFKLFTPIPTDWNQSYSKNDKIPYGSYILYEELSGLFPDGKIETSNLPFYNLTKQSKIENKNIIIICQYFNPDELDSKILFDLIKDGSEIFIAASGFGKEIADSFNITNNVTFWQGFDSTSVNFVNTNLKRENNYKFTQGNYDHYFYAFDTSRVIVLGNNNQGFANFIKVKFGKGNIYYHSIPNIFTNYNLLKPDRDYIFKSLSYLKNRDVIWDEYYKEANQYQSTPIRYILSQPSLKWGYFTFLFAIILFVIFKGKRDQRIIPVIKPLANTTLEFIQTVGNVYFKQSNHKNIALKRITYFMDYIRTKYSIKTIHFSDELVDRLYEKSLIDKIEIKNLINLFNLIEIAAAINQETLIELNNQIENFYLKTGAYGK